MLGGLLKILGLGRSEAVNACPAMSPSSGASDISHQAGIRSLPLTEAWNPTLALRPGRNRQRVAISRALDELFPLCGYLNRMIPEEGLGNGLNVSSLSKDENFRRASTGHFDLWGSSLKIDVRGEVNIYSCQSMLGNYISRDGEIFSLKVKSTREEDYRRPLSDKSFRAIQLQFIRRDQVGHYVPSLFTGRDASPYFQSRWDDGILLDDLDRAVKYSILRRTDSTATAQSRYEVAAKDIIHLKEPGLEGIHGQPMCFRGQDCCIDALDLRALSKYADKIRAAFLGVITTASGDVPASMRNAVQKGTKPDPADPTKKVEDKNIRYYEIAAGVQIPVLRKDEQITFFTGHSNLTFGEQLVMLFREVLFSYLVPPEYVIEFRTLGSAGARMCLRKIKKVLDRIRRPFIEVFLQQVWEMVIADAIARRQLPLVEDWNVIHCKGAPDPSIDAGRDEKAEQERIRSFTGTIEGYCDGLGLTGENVRHSRLDEIADNIRYAEKIGLPWYLAIDPNTLQALAGLAKIIGTDMDELSQMLKREAD